jgi:hypothetical protein
MDKKSSIANLKVCVLFLLIFLLLVSIVACESLPKLDWSGLGSGTGTPFSAEVMKTVTARALEKLNSGGELATSYAKATALNQETTAQAEIDNADLQATVTANLPVFAELPIYGVSPLDGHVAWIHNPLTLDLNGYTQKGYANDYPAITAADFVLVSDITWNTLAASAGCGFLFRSNGNKTSPSQFMVYISKYANGTVYFTATLDGNIANSQVFYALSKDKSFHWLNDSTNRLAVVARGTLLDIYTNGVMVGEVDLTQPPPKSVSAPIFPMLPANPTDAQIVEYNTQVSHYKLISEQMQSNLTTAQKNYDSSRIIAMNDGFLAFMSVSEYGHTVCKFSNAWLFLIGRPPTPTPNLTWTRTPTLTPTLTEPYRSPVPTWTPSKTPIPPTETVTPYPNYSGTATAACATQQANFPGTPCP